MKISPSIFIGKPESTTEAGLTFVLLVVTVSPGSHSQPVVFPGGEWFQGNDNGGALLYLKLFIVCAVAHEPAVSTHTAPGVSWIFNGMGGEKHDRQVPLHWNILIVYSEGFVHFQT